MRFDKHQFVIIVFFCMLIAVFAIMQYCPLRNQAHAVEQVKSAQLAAAEKTEEQIRNLPALRSQLEEMKSNIENISKRIPYEPMLGAFLKEIADVMHKHRLTEQMVQPEVEIKMDGNINCIPVKMQCKGNLRQIYGFFGSLQNLDRLIKIEQIQLKNDQQLSGMLTMIATGNIYYRTSGSKNTI